MSKATTRTLRQIYDAMYKALGPQKWWPGESPVEIIVGAILTQNTNWGNVERAIANLKAAGLLDWKALRRIEMSRLAELIRPAGYFNVKARRLKNFVDWLWRRHEGDLSRLAAIELGRLREELLSINGVGPETADSILLYALERPTFVVDAYTARVMRRHGMTFSGYAELQAIFEDHLPREVGLFNEYHALIVAVGKDFCRPKARCETCPLRRFKHDETA
jgi:endonuclease-3 related protein